jgi:dTMP kinase
VNTILIAIEGSDGVGKDTQSNLLYDFFVNNEMTVSQVSFPRYKQTAGGWALFEALKGGNKDAYDFANVDPYSASLLYAADRKQSLPFLKDLIARHDVVIFDRYVDSNLIHQGGKFASEKKRKEFGLWLQKLEYEMLFLPEPHITIYLELPAHISINRAEKRAREMDTTPDAVESNHDYIRNSHYAGIFYARMFDWLIIPCVTAEGYELTRDEVHRKIVSTLSSRLKLPFDV